MDSNQETKCFKKLNYRKPSVNVNMCVKLVAIVYGAKVTKVTKVRGLDNLIPSTLSSTS